MIKRRSRLETALVKMDSKSFPDRLERLKFLNEILGPYEIYYFPISITDKDPEKMETMII